MDSQRREGGLIAGMIFPYLVDLPSKLKGIRKRRRVNENRNLEVKRTAGDSCTATPTLAAGGGRRWRSGGGRGRGVVGGEEADGGGEEGDEEEDDEELNPYDCRSSRVLHDEGVVPELEHGIARVGWLKQRPEAQVRALEGLWIGRFAEHKFD
ncbi:hypothetical protein SAY87_005844 [Trapa incisa]|uniref:Uncharacterized protein n=1 Tax=Trapa incisa TaxID=236973 RepID=A0AAN7Q777_9MYRT|nr:hypothetical protein SAY87_005844 [Trapa incisa]